MSASPDTHYTVFAGTHRVAAGDLADAARAAREALDSGITEQVLIFANATGRQVDVELNGSPDDVAARIRQQHEQAATANDTPARSRGRPKLGVIAREVTLLPRHWAWLKAQRGGASATLRRLVEDASRDRNASARARRANDAVFHFMNTMAGNLPGYEDALRAFYRDDAQQFEQRIADWPHDIRQHIEFLVAVARDESRDAKATR